ncbi:transglutaminase family protein [Glaciimonas immobilis]|uniref:Transglutaminase-like putative cysteine protease n=1 Tax=Glaciimonas immobilis TaxID=728004 RepID=A0A840RX52_9BURK|nr:transglutaminase family protein [Glaciimonas immobilis]KAF3998588.1 transglutaminase family protein [Glaciimonas immobilis]MBB5201446.1 transglutaminase-like putative cysteine protease [Glaciimonas immobilis]
MLLTIRHETIYRYTEELTYTIQQLRLTPRAEAHQRTIDWHITSTGARHPFVDAFGNLSHMLTITIPHTYVRIVAEGTVAVTPLFLGRLPQQGTFSPFVFTVASPLTQPTSAIIAFAHKHLIKGANSNQLLALAQAICGTVAYQSGSTLVTSSADDALRLGRGVCQDHAHLFLACCHVVGIPACYVSGYIDPGNSDHAESHAWVDAWVEQADFTGWISIDVTHACFASNAYCRLAIGRDYESAAPVRGVRRGGGAETLSVNVNVIATT